MTYSLPERIIEIISQMPSKKAKPNADSPRIENPYILGPTPVACIMAELKRIELTIRLNEILLLDLSISRISFSSPICVSFR
jgi:hypothetical protein